MYSHRLDYDGCVASGWVAPGEIDIFINVPVMEREREGKTVVRKL